MPLLKYYAKLFRPLNVALNSQHESNAVLDAESHLRGGLKVGFQ